jgi:hypothetical protein
MRFFPFLNYQISRYLKRWRWLLPIPAGLLLGYWASAVIRVLSAASGADQSVLNGNALEAFLWAFGKPEIVYFVVSALFLYLVSDFLPGPAFEQNLLVRLGSRGQRWFAKVSLLFLSTWLYALLLFGSFFLVVLPSYPFSAEWSPAGLNNFGMGLGYVLKNGSPVQGALSIAAFLLVGWFAIGLLVLTVNQLTGRSWAGFLCGAMILVTADLGPVLGGPIGGQGWQSFFMIQNHLEYTPLWAPTRIIPEAASWIFWAVWIVLCGLIAWFTSKRADILAMEH